MKPNDADHKKEKIKSSKHDAQIQQEIEELKKQVQILTQEKEELFNKLQRIGADYANFQKRTPKQIADAVAYEKEKILKSLLPAMDNFDHTLQNIEKSENIEVLVKGIKIIYDQMIEILKSHKVQQIVSIGEHFDPNLHQAMMRQADPEKEDGIVLDEFQKGYKLNDRVLRPCKVVVNQQPQENQDQDNNQE